MRTVSLREANQAFPRLIADVEAGEEIVILKRGRPVARLVPVPAVQSASAGAELMEFLNRAARPMGGRPASRDEAHER